ncbi:MAG TPA: Rnf-Nqr domain containing protein, partial [Bacteroidales bacterium]|nr:Rnf-Nqr domain containing protein [Bacteroidales bacterium]
MDQLKNFTKGFIRENPVFALFLGLCPTLGVTTTAINGLGMGLATTFVLVMSNIVVSLIKNFIPDKVRIPSFIVIIAS